MTRYLLGYVPTVAAVAVLLSVLGLEDPTRAACLAIGAITGGIICARNGWDAGRESAARELAAEAAAARRDEIARAAAAAAAACRNDHGTAQ